MEKEKDKDEEEDKEGEGKERREEEKDKKEDDDGYRRVLQERVAAAALARGRRFAHEEVTDPAWAAHGKHVFVVSAAGKPVYARYGDEHKMAAFMASLSAIVSFVSDMGDAIRYVRRGGVLFVFLVRGPIVFLSISRTRESVAQILHQLGLVHQQILSVLTSSVERILERSAHFDLRELLGGADRFIDSLASLIDRDPCAFLGAIHCLRLPADFRTAVSAAVQAARTDELLYAVVLAGRRLVTLVRPRRYLLHPSDLLLLVNFVTASGSFRAGESWTPLCLPRFSPDGFLHAYVHFLAPEVCLVLVSPKAEAFFALSRAKDTIAAGFARIRALEQIGAALVAGDYAPHLPARGPAPLHFVYKSRATCQLTHPAHAPPYTNRREQRRLFRLYLAVHDQLHAAGEVRAHKMYFQSAATEAVVAWVAAGFELYAAFLPFETKSACIRACNEVLAWINQEEESLFILNSPLW